MFFRTQEELKHYASKYYDPVKAHEYYMRTRELKGRRSTRALNDEDKKTWSYVKNQIMTARKQELETVKKDRTSKIAAFRSQARQKREAIAAKLRRIADARIRKLEALKSSQKLEKVPKNASPKEKETIRKRNERIRSENEKLKEQNARVKEGIRKDARTQSDAARQERTRVAKDLRTSVENARNNFVKQKDLIVDKYLKILDEEYNKIKNISGRGVTAIQKPVGDAAARKKYRNS